MADLQGQDLGEAEPVFAARKNHGRCRGRPPRLRNTAAPGLHRGCFENAYSEQFVFTLERATGTGTVASGDLGWDDPRSFTLELLYEGLGEIQRVAAQVIAHGRTKAAGGQ
jgi:hypothetical protein